MDPLPSGGEYGILPSDMLQLRVNLYGSRKKDRREKAGISK